MKIEIAYCLPSGDEHLPYTYRFISTYMTHPPNCEHDTIILTDPGYKTQAEELFVLFPNVTVFVSNVPGKDIGRYQAYARISKADFVFWFGGSTYFRRPGWGMRMMLAIQQHGKEHLYGTMGNCGSGPVKPHIRTTGFACSPDLINRHPLRITNDGDRYAWEHRDNCLTEWVRNQGLRAIVVDFQTIWEYPRWNENPHGYGGSTRTNSDILVGDRLS